MVHFLHKIVSPGTRRAHFVLFLFYATVNVSSCQVQPTRLNCTDVGTGPSTCSTATALFVSQDWFLIALLQIREVLMSYMKDTTQLTMP